MAEKKALLPDEAEQTGQWAILPAKVRYDPGIPANAKLIYAEIAAKCNIHGYCFCHNKWFAEKFKIKPDTVSSLVARLEKSGYICIDVDNSRINNERRKIYLTAKPYDFLGGIGFKSETRLGFKTDTVSDLNPRPIENNNIKTKPPIVPQGGRRSRREPKKQPDWKPERFAGFWSFYPRGEAKQRAIEAWDKLRPSDETIAQMGRALKDQMSSEQWQQGIGIPYASTWINAQRWTDEQKPQSRNRSTGGWAESEVVIP